jgi:hypothetical protein
MVSLHHRVWGSDQWSPKQGTGGTHAGPQLTVLETNETHPARVRCRATCLNQQGTYIPTMALIVTSEERFIPVYGARDRFYSRDGLHFEVRKGNVSYCEERNNYTMEYEYLITSDSSEIARSVVIILCGVEAFIWQSPYHQHCRCWGQSYGIIRPDVDTIADDWAPTNNSLSTQLQAYTDHNM